MRELTYCLLALIRLDENQALVCRRTATQHPLAEIRVKNNDGDKECNDKNYTVCFRNGNLLSLFTIQVRTLTIEHLLLL